VIFLADESELSVSDKLSVLYFYTSWIPYNKKMITILSNSSQKYNDINFIAIDADKFSSLCTRFNVTNVPNIIFLSNALEIKRIEGVVMSSAFKATLLNVINSINQ
jgi:thiol-disulfide isomerase/thioredoxin